MIYQDLFIESLRGIRQMFRWSDSSSVERNFTLGQSPNIWGNFSKISIKINKNLKNYSEILRKNADCSEFFKFSPRANFLIIGKIRNIIWAGYSGGSGGTAPRR